MKIAVALSGGIDSSVAAMILKQQGHVVYGVTLQLFDPEDPLFNCTATASKNIDDARSVAETLGIPHHVINLEKDFIRQIIEPFCSEYMSGRTPNPCVHCDASIKYRALHEFALSHGCEKIATGHYARLEKTSSGRYYISMALDRSRDQSYFLFMLPQEFLAYTLFPLGEYTKSQVRELARRGDLHVAERPDSQEICFVPDNNYSSFIERFIKSRPPEGDIVNIAGQVIGKHTGIHRYTIGQRRGLGIAAPRPLYVIKIDARNNRIIAGYKEDLDRPGLTVRNINYMKVADLNGLGVTVKTRSTQQPAPAFLEEKKGSVTVTFKEPQSGITPGQAAVFYDQDLGILGGGIIELDQD